MCLNNFTHQTYTLYVGLSPSAKQASSSYECYLFELSALQLNGHDIGDAITGHNMSLCNCWPPRQCLFWTCFFWRVAMFLQKLAQLYTVYRFNQIFLGGWKQLILSQYYWWTNLCSFWTCFKTIENTKVFKEISPKTVFNVLHNSAPFRSKNIHNF